MLYPRDPKDGKELYFSGKYLTDSFGNEIYAKLGNGDEYFLKKNNKLVWAKRREKFYKTSELFDFMNDIMEPYFPLKHSGKPIYKEDEIVYPLNLNYPKDNKGCEMYPEHPKHSGQFYMNKSSFRFLQSYAYNEHGKRYYACDQYQRPYYAQRETLTEFREMPIDYNKIITSKDGNELLYPKWFSKSSDQVFIAYPLDSKNNPYYIKLNGKEMYGRVSNLLPQVYAKNVFTKNEFFARNSNGNFYYAQDPNGNQIYPRNKSGIPIYLSLNSQEIYARKSNGDEFYATFKTKEVCARNENYKRYYASIKNNLIEIYPQMNKKEYYLLENEFEVCAIEKTNKRPFYAKDEFSNEYYPMSLKIPYYITYNQKEIYAKKSNQDEFYIRFGTKDHCAKNEFGMFYYASTNNNLIEKYPQLNGTEFYIHNQNNLEVCAVEKTKQIPFYAKNEFSSEYYPMNLKDNVPYYITYNQKEIYARNINMDQIYLKIGNKEILATDKVTNNHFYARTKYNLEIYPRIKQREYYKIINNKEICAVNKITNIPFYAKNEYFDEFYPRQFL